MRATRKWPRSEPGSWRADCAVAVCDVSDEIAVAPCCQLALDRFGSLDIIVNDAGLMTFKALQAKPTPCSRRALTQPYLQRRNF
jgi:NAD(P)-dependent dehydrogenase (short-subunit alcohol dehydrogenase family)